jgi:conjugal transfer mating pair stabilization protein TraG
MNQNPFPNKPDAPAQEPTNVTPMEAAMESGAVAPGTAGDPALGPQNQGPMPGLQPQRKWDPFDSLLIAGGDFYRGGKDFNPGVKFNPIQTAKDFFSTQAPEGDQMKRRVKQPSVSGGQLGAILDLIAGPESAGNYNAVYSKANSDVDLSKMSLGEIKEYQKTLLKQNGGSAIGRYQFIPKTLQAVQKRMGLDDSTPFTPELQDQMATELLKDAGYEKFTAGGLPEEQFANNLSKIWAGLPKDASGKSYYDGVAGNKAHVPYEDVLEALSRARQETPTQQSQAQMQPAVAALPQADGEINDPLAFLKENRMSRAMARRGTGGLLGSIAQLATGYDDTGFSTEEQMIINALQAKAKSGGGGQWARLNDGTLYNTATGEFRGAGDTGGMGGGMTPKEAETQRKMAAELPHAFEGVANVRNLLKEAKALNATGPVRGSAPYQLYDRMTAGMDTESDARTRVRQGLNMVGVESTLEGLSKIGGSDTEREFQWLREIEVNSSMTDGEIESWLTNFERKFDKSLAALRSKGILTPQLEEQIRAQFELGPTSAADKKADEYLY